MVRENHLFTSSYAPCNVANRVCSEMNRAARIPALRDTARALCMLMLLQTGQPAAEPGQLAVPGVELAAAPGARGRLTGAQRLRGGGGGVAMVEAAAHEAAQPGSAAQGSEPTGAQVRSPFTHSRANGERQRRGERFLGERPAHDASVISCVVEDEGGDVEPQFGDEGEPTGGLAPPVKRRRWSNGRTDVGHGKNAGPGEDSTRPREDRDEDGEADENEDAAVLEGVSESEEGYDALRVVDEVVDGRHENGEGGAEEDSAEGGAEDAEGAEGASEEEEFKPWREQRWPLDLNAVLKLYNSMNETLSLEAGEYQLDALVRVEGAARIDYAQPADDAHLQRVNESVTKAQVAAAASAKAEIVEEVALTGEKILVQQRVASSEGVVVRLWGPWSMGARSSGSIRRICTVQQTDTPEDPTLEVEGRWIFEWCAIRSSGGTAVLVHSLGDATVRSCALGSMPSQAPAKYGITATDSAKCVVEKSTLQRCRVLGARFLLQANATLVDCTFQRCSVEGAHVVRSTGSAGS